MIVNIEKAINHVAHGGVVIYPTETAYALGCDATNSRATKKIFQFKKRAYTKTSAIIVDSYRRARECALFSKKAEALAKKYWPAPLTLVLPATKNFPKEIVNESGEIGIRVSPHPVPSAITKKLGIPLVATSANVSGGKTCFSLQCIKRQFKNLNDIYIVDGGTLARGKLSTVLRVTGNTIEILRQGALAL